MQIFVSYFFIVSKVNKEGYINQLFSNFELTYIDKEINRM